MEAKEEKKSGSRGCEWAVISLIALTIVFSGAWLWKMSDVLKSPPGHVEVRHVYANFSNDDKKGVEKEEAQYTLYKQAEETLREQMNTWLTIVGFFGVLFGLIVPLASYLLQRRSLSEERERIMEGVKESAAAAAEKAAEKASKEAADAKTAAEAASKAAKNDAADAKKAADNAATEAKKALDEVGTAKEELQKQLDDALGKIEETSRQAQEAIRSAQEAKAVADMAQKMAKNAGKEAKPTSEVLLMHGEAAGAAKSKFEKIKKEAEAGDSEAQNSLGCMYADGDGVEKDELMAVCWYQRAAKQGYSLAQYNLGLAYYFARGVDKNYTKAMHWFRQAADQKNADAVNNIGVMLEYGLDCDKNGQEALEMYRKAAELGSVMGRVNLAGAYEEDKFGAGKDLTKANKLYQQVVDDPNAGEKAKKLAQEGLDRIAKLEGEK